MSSGGQEMSQKPDYQKSKQATELQDPNKKPPFVKPKLTKQDSLVRSTLMPGPSGDQRDRR